MFKLLIIICLFALSHQIFADSLNLIINGKAFHEEKKNYNENNWGLGIEYNFREKKKWISFINGGYFKDSNSNTSQYFGGGVKRRFSLTANMDGWYIDAGVTAFIMKRKYYKSNDPFLAALPFLSLGKGKFAVNATYVPSMSPKFVSLLFFQASYKILEW